MPRHCRSVLAALVTAALAVAATSAGAQPPDAWSLLARLRGALAGPAPVEALFEQTFIPAGFTEGEQETGSVSFSLPECLRWDYNEPFAKSYLLCGHTAWTWNRGEESGRRYLVAADEESGLDLLRLNVDEIRRRYRAEAEAASEGRWTVRLAPLGKETPILDAELLIEPEGERLAALLYHDREGNLTRFTFDGYRLIARQGHFEPPPGLHWLTQ